MTHKSSGKPTELFGVIIEIIYERLSKLNILNIPLDAFADPGEADADDASEFPPANKNVYYITAKLTVT